MTHQTVDNSSHMFDAAQFLRSFVRAYSLTEIDHGVSDLKNNKAISTPIVTKDEIVRSIYLSMDAKELFRMAKYHSDFNVRDDELIKELSFFQQLVREVLFILKRTVVDDSNNIKLSIIQSGLDQLWRSIDFGDMSELEKSGRGASIATIELLLHRLDYHAIYRGFSNSTPLAKYFIITQAIHRSTQCQIQPMWNN